MINNYSSVSDKYSLDPFSLKVSVITATYNVEKYLDDCILSVINQSYKNFEYIIIDGGSNDGTVNIIKQYEDQLAYWISEPDQGIYDAWNKGLARAKGDWIIFIGADDLLYPDALQSYVHHIIHHPQQHELEFVSSHIELVEEDLSTIRIVGDVWNWERFKREMITYHVGTFHAKRLFSKYGIFNTAYKISGDYELLLRPKDKLVASFVDHLTVKMRVGGVSNLNLFRASSETYKAKITHGAISVSRGYLLIVVDKIRLFIRSTFGWKGF